MTFNIETVSGNIAKPLTSNEIQFTIISEMLTAVVRDQGWPDVVVELRAFFKICFCFVLLYDWSLGEQSLSVKYWLLKHCSSV